MPRSLDKPLAIDIASPAFNADPYPTLARMREAGPVIPVRLPFLGRTWLTTTHEAAEAVVKGRDRFVLEGKNVAGGGKSGVIGLRWWMPRSVRLLTNNMLAKDDPDHRRLRKLVDQAFGRRGVLDMRPRIEAMADALLDEMAGKAEVDLVAAYARRLPLEVISDLLGVPAAERARFEAWSTSLTGVTGGLGMMRMLWSVGKLTGYVRAMIEQIRAAPRPGLIHEMIRAEAEGDRLGEDELIAMTFLLMVAGMETTTNLIAGSVLALERNPDQKAWLLADPPGRIERGVEELTRFVTAVAGTKPRYVADDTGLCGQPLGRGDTIMAFLAAANADPAVFEAPERLMLDRFPNPHLSFSAGVHFCLGLQLARVETQSALVRLYARYPDLRLAGPGTPDFAGRLGHTALRTLRILPGAPS